MKQRLFMEELVTLGLEVENTSIFFKKKSAILLEALPQKTYGNDKIVTELVGPLSLAFAQLVYLPHVKRFNEVSLDDQNIIIRQMVDLQQKKVETVALEKKLEQVVATYISSQQTSLSFFPTHKKNLINTSKKENSLQNHHVK
ncbi:MAG: hypothetical protein PSV35_07725 [bacterium]|nr:hypothetical protein [bacterium]